MQFKHKRNFWVFQNVEFLNFQNYLFQIQPKNRFWWPKLQQYADDFDMPDHVRFLGSAPQYLRKIMKNIGMGDPCLGTGLYVCCNILKKFWGFQRRNMAYAKPSACDFLKYME